MAFQSPVAENGRKYGKTKVTKERGTLDKGLKFLKGTLKLLNQCAKCFALLHEIPSENNLTKLKSHITNYLSKHVNYKIS